jgi:hypothetical protein
MVPSARDVRAGPKALAEHLYDTSGVCHIRSQLGMYASTESPVGSSSREELSSLRKALDAPSRALTVVPLIGACPGRRYDEALRRDR